MDMGQSTLLNAGAKDQILLDFGALAESLTQEGLPKYNLRPTLESLAKILTAQAGGPNKDLALFELCHLVYGVSEIVGKEGVMDFFLDPQKATPNHLQQRLGLEKGRLSLSYGETLFEIRSGRLPVLVAFYEFLCGMDHFAHYEDITVLFETLCATSISSGSVKNCTNALASILRKYRMANLTSHQADGKFLQVYKFLKDQGDETYINLTDDAVFEFWCLHNTGKDYRGYRTVFDLFCDFAAAYDEADRVRSSAHASPLGLDREAGEVDMADAPEHDDMAREWVSPFDVFDDDDLSDIRFFKKKSERGPIESLMAYGPEALRLPLAFLRYEIFGQVQSGITNDLQVGRGRESVAGRVSCENVSTYLARVQECEKILDHIQALEKSTLHVVASKDDRVVSFSEAAQEKTRAAFKKMHRKGFDDTAHQRTDDFEKASEALLVMERQLDKYVSLIRSTQMLDRFEQDRDAFSKQFNVLYGEVLA